MNQDAPNGYHALTPKDRQLVDNIVRSLLGWPRQEEPNVQFNMFLLALAKARGEGK